MANLFREGNTTGRPPKYKNKKQLEKKIEEYFDWVEENEKPISITGLVLFLGYSDKRSFYDLENIEEFSHSIKRARTCVENWYEMGLNKHSATGSIFALKNFGWVDKQEHTVTNTNVVLDMNPTNKENQVEG